MPRNSRQTPRLLLLAALCAALGGCMLSSRPLFAPDTAAPALGEGGRYAIHERKDDGRFEYQEDMTVRRRADSGYDFVNAKGDTTQISLHAVSGDLYAGQSSTAPGRGFGYVLFQVAPNEVEIFSPQCKDQDKSLLAAAGVEIRNDECWLDKVADPRALFAALKRGEPVSKMVRK